MLKISLWMQCKVPQIKLKVLPSKIKFTVPQVQGQAAQGPVNNNAQVGQNVPMQPPQQPAPAQLVPTGPVVPAAQVFYQNWIGKKLEFSGKPEEDAESHLLSTRDWMEVQTSPMKSKLDVFA